MESVRVVHAEIFAGCAILEFSNGAIVQYEANWLLENSAEDGNHMVAFEPDRRKRNWLAGRSIDHAP
jgi:hypothetical protein